MSSNPRLAIGSDHGGLALKYELLPAIAALDWHVLDVGCAPLEAGVGIGVSLEEATGRLVATAPVDYPDFAERVANMVATNEAELGLLLCGSGIGMAIAANKVAGVRAAVCHEPYSAEMARAHNNANVLCMGGRIVGPELAKATLRAFLTGQFAGERHQRRVDKITKIEEAQRTA